MTEAMSDESALCTACGLCCTGALHDYAQLQEDEVGPAEAIGLPVDRASTKPRFLMPCPKLDGSFCTIYGARPRVCSGYACRLLEEVRGGRPLHSALPVVAEARRLGEELRAALPPGLSLPAIRRSLFAPDRPAPIQLRAIAFTHYLDRHFRNGKEGTMLKSELPQ